MIRRTRVETDPGGRPQHWLRPSVQARRSVRACSGMLPEEGSRYAYMAAEANDFACKECADRRAAWLAYHQHIEDSRIDLYEDQE